MAEETFSEKDFSLNANNLIQDFITYGDELSSLRDINESFFGGTPSAINSPILGKKLYDLWEENITNNLGGFIDAYEGWIDQLKAEGKVLEEFSRNKNDLYAQAGMAEASVYEQMKNVELSGAKQTEQTFSNTLLSLSGLTEDEAKAWTNASDKDIKAVEKLFFKGTSFDEIKDPNQQSLYKVLSAKYAQDKSGEFIKSGNETIADSLAKGLKEIDDQGNRIIHTKKEIDEMIKSAGGRSSSNAISEGGK